MPKPQLRLIETRNDHGLTFEQWRRGAGFTDEDIRQNVVDPADLKEAWLDCQDEAEWRVWNDKRRERPKNKYNESLSHLEASVNRSENGKFLFRAPWDPQKPLDRLVHELQEPWHGIPRPACLPRGVPIPFKLSIFAEEDPEETEVVINSTENPSE